LDARDGLGVPQAESREHEHLRTARQQLTVKDAATLLNTASPTVSLMASVRRGG
jgi:hypothetical protein